METRVQAIEDVAHLSVARGSSFAGFGIALFSLAFAIAGDPVLATKMAGALSLFACFVLMCCAGAARSRPYWNTEAWAMLQPARRPHDSEAQSLIGRVLRRAYLSFARLFALTSIMSFSATLLVQLAAR